MKGEWCYFKSFLSKKDCEKIIQDFKEIPYKDGTVGVSNSEKLDSQIRKSRIKFVYSNDKKFGYLFDLFWKTALQANQDFFQFHISRLSYIQFAEYDASYQGEYKAHQDVFWINNDNFYHRKLSSTVQLSDPQSYEGGNLKFFDLNEYPPEDDIRAQGTITYFPSFVQHQITPVTKGLRYSLVAWFDGKKWT